MHRELSTAIRNGKKMGNECQYGWHSCVIGLAHLGLTGEIFSPVKAGYTLGSFAEEWAADHGFDPVITRKAEQMHVHGTPAMQIADWLDSLEPRISDEQYTADFIRKMENTPQLETQHG